MYTLYSYYRSSCSWRVRLALEIKGIPYTMVQINLLENDQNGDEYLIINPGGVVPALVLENGIVLTQSVAIMEYLEESHVQTTPLLSDDPLKRALVRQLVQVIASDCQPLQNLHVLRKISFMMNLESDAEARLVWGCSFIEKALQTYQKLISNSRGLFSVGDSVSMADCCLIPQLYSARRFGINVEMEFPVLAEIEKHFQTIYPNSFF